MTIPIDDLAITQGVTAVERIRADAGRLFQVDLHFKRWYHTLSVLGIDSLPNPKPLRELIDEVIDRNIEWVAANPDFGVILLASPSQSKGSTFVIDLFPIDRLAMKQRIDQGSALLTTEVKLPDPSCWPRSIKVRSRLHYYLAERQVRQHDPDALAVLLDNDGTITETAIANVLIVEHDQLLSPPVERILFGVSMQTVVELARRHGITWNQQPISIDRLREADEVLLTGTSCGLWFANRINGQNLPTDRPVYRKLRDAFDEFVRSQ
ncbi:aminotransferase class IV [Rhodopirellula sp. MGV]|uniref:aminotransferase class IV n=1 Tax=Rhodopirellula sp. MGV TaxID=2023130 RepID=UPI0013040564|nr:aminotransferase class IV [Rhodopirellula sp. MGV]